ncbi:right-handed parallel beta-helix repeat-containing protein [Klebsiella oxytoca]|uniref:Right handed beta helix domain-containing protein n=1 Tax=Klebsiella oxytoca TaxID=571 RepID=A0A6B8MQU3_KLEOX|nr:right-handed parallel beta-helix repeat-containing protein [Klebsiella oxytoca]QGN38812.1 hypothetical protein GJ746_16595 [Klebsiella oxytoca]
MRRREFILGLPLIIYSSKEMLANGEKNILGASPKYDSCGYRQYTHAENEALLTNYCNKYNILFEDVNRLSNVVKLCILDDVVDGDSLIMEKIAEATSSSSCLYIYGGGTLSVSSEIETQVSIIGDGKTRLKQKEENMSLLVITKSGVTIQNIIIIPSNKVKSIKKAGVEIREVELCKLLNLKIQYVGEDNTEGNGITINQGDRNVVCNCSFTGANLADNIFHNQGGNDISVYGASSRNIVALNYSVGRNIRGIFQLNDLLGKNCDENIYIANYTDGALGYGHLCYEKRHDENTTMRGTKFLRGVIKNISGSVRIPNGKYKGKKIFGMGVYNQAGKDTYIEDYFIDSVCSDSQLIELLPIAAIGSTIDTVTIKNNTIINSGFSGIKVSTFTKDSHNKLTIINNDIKNIKKDGVVVLNCMDILVNNLKIVNCNYSLRLNNIKSNAGLVSLSMIESSKNKGISINNISKVRISNFSSTDDAFFLIANNVNDIVIENGVVANSKEMAFYISKTCDNIMINSISIVNSKIGLNIPKWSLLSNVNFKNNINNLK